MIIDAHTHIFPDKIAKKATQNIGEFYNISMEEDGTLANLIKKGDEYNIDKFLVHSVAVTPEQVPTITDYIAAVIAKHPNRFIGFNSLHPDFKDIAKETEKAIRLGIKGVKLHPDFQKFNIDSKEAFNIYEILEGRLPVLIHTGDNRTDYSHPKRLINVIKKFPKLSIIAAHFGGWSVWEDAVNILANTGVYVDTSSSSYWLDDEKMRKYMDAYGEDYCIFGSDYPMWNTKKELDRISRLFKNEKEREKVLYKNIKKLVKLD